MDSSTSSTQENPRTEPKDAQEEQEEDGSVRAVCSYRLSAHLIH
jgi:hypothetical protein